MNVFASGDNGQHRYDKRGLWIIVPAAAWGVIMKLSRYGEEGDGMESKPLLTPPPPLQGLHRAGHGRRPAITPHHFDASRLRLSTIHQPDVERRRRPSDSPFQAVLVCLDVTTHLPSSGVVPFPSRSGGANVLVMLVSSAGGSMSVCSCMYPYTASSPAVSGRLGGFHMHQPVLPLSPVCSSTHSNVPAKTRTIYTSSQDSSIHAAARHRSAVRTHRSSICSPRFLFVEILLTASARRQLSSVGSPITTGWKVRNQDRTRAYTGHCCLSVAILISPAKGYDMQYPYETFHSPDSLPKRLSE